MSGICVEHIGQKEARLFRKEVTGERLDVYDPQEVHQLHLSSMVKALISVERSEEQIDKMWQYNALMGKGLSYKPS